MKFKILSVFFVCVLLFGTFASCNHQKTKNKYTAQTFEYFDTVTVITGYENSKEEFDTTSNRIISMLAEYHKLYTIYHRFDSVENLCTINDTVNGQHSTVKVDSRIIDMLLYAKEMYTVTGGEFNIAMGSVLSLWHDYRTVGKDNPDNATLPPKEKLLEASQHTDINDLVIDKENSTVTILDPQMTLDVGAIAKGYATEQIALWLENEGKTGYVLNVGGNVRTVGPKAEGEKWTVGVEKVSGDGYLAYLQLDGQSVVTSGSYQRYYVVDGKQYHHIIDPDTLMPSEEYLSVSVICKDSGLGDVLSTALFCMPQEEGIRLIESMADVEALWVSSDGEQTVSSGWNAYLKQ